MNGEIRLANCALPLPRPQRLHSLRVWAVVVVCCMLGLASAVPVSSWLGLEPAR